MEGRAFVYCMASGRNGTLYLGSTVDLVRRAWEHRTGVIEGFTRRYGCKLLVWYEAVGDWEAARSRERQMKEWKRAWKVREIEGLNPEMGRPVRSDRAALSVSRLDPGLRRGGQAMEIG